MDPLKIETVEMHFKSGKIHFRYKYISNKHYSTRQYWNESGTRRVITKRQGFKNEGSITGPKIYFNYK
jgi:hypothetical protein